MAEAQFGVDIQLNKNELKQAVVENQGLAPTSPKDGQIYYHTESGKKGVKVYKTGTTDAWKKLLDEDDTSNFVTTSRTVNNKALSSDITLYGTDIAMSSTDATTVKAAIETKQATITGAATTIVSSDLTASKALISNASGKVAVSSVTSTELGYVSGVTSSIQTQLDNKVPKPATALTAATKCKITYDANGLITAGADLQASDIPNLTTTKINALTDYAKGSSSAALATTDTLNQALSKLENQIDTKVSSNASITGATKCKITYDSKGLVTSGADLSASDIPSITLSKISDVTATATEVNVLDGITASTAELNYTDGVTSNIQTQLDNRVNVKPDGTNNLIDSGNKVALTYLPDVVVGQMLYAGTVVPSTAVATLTANAKTKLGTTSNTITLTNDTTAITGYTANEGNYYICSADGTFAGTAFLVGDWLVATSAGWKKIDNTDAVTGVKGNAESTYRIGNVNITADNVLPTQTSNSGKFLTTNGTTASWATVDALPSQTGHSGKFLTTNGTTASWDTAVTPAGTQTLTNKTIDADDNTISDLTTSNLKSGVLQTSVRAAASASDTAIASEKAIRTELDLKAPLASPALTGTPTAPTATAGTNTTQIATTAFVQNASKYQTITLTQTNPALTQSGGVCTWTITNSFNNPYVIGNVREESTGEEIYCNIVYTLNNITIKINSTSNIAAGTYRAVIIGQVVSGSYLDPGALPVFNSNPAIDSH